MAASPSSSRTSVLAWATALVAFAALALATRAYGQSFPGVYVTPDLRVSSVGLPTWDGIRQGLHFPERVVAVDGRSLDRSEWSYAATSWDRAIARASAEGRRTVRVRVQDGDAEREVELGFAPLSPLAWWLNAGIPIFIGFFYVVAAMVARAANPRGALARTFARTALASALLLATFFDFHTSRVLVPLSDLAICVVASSYLVLGLRLPDDVGLLQRFPRLERLIHGVGLAVGAMLITLHRAPEAASVARQLVTVAFGVSQLVFLGTVVVRFLLANGERRAKLRSLLLAIVFAHSPVGVLALIGAFTARGSIALMFLLPALALAPFATFVAFVRHDIWASRALLVRRDARAVLLGLVCLLAIGVASAVVSPLGGPVSGALVASAMGAVIAASLSTLGLGRLDEAVFSSRAEYKPTIEQLSEELAALVAPEEVAAAVERTVRRWLPCDDVRFTLIDAATDTPSEKVALGRPGGHLQLKVRFDGRSVGQLEVGPKRGGAVFTGDDMDLLRTIANQAALAIAHARAYAELEQRRLQQAAAWRDERSAIIETVAAEIAHEVRYPINFFRSIFRRGARALDDEAVEIGMEEVDRLERLVAGLRRVALASRLERSVVPLLDLAARAEMVLRDAIGDRRLELEIPDSVELRCAPDQVTQILVNTLSNALDAAGPDGELGVRWRETAKGGEIVVWDRGSGFASEISNLFTPWFTTKPRGTGLGLAITQRLVRAHGWAIDAVRREGRTEFVIAVPECDFGFASRSEVA